MRRFTEQSLYEFEFKNGTKMYGSLECTFGADFNTRNFLGAKGEQAVVVMLAENWLTRDWHCTVE